MDQFIDLMWTRWFVKLYNPPHPPRGGLDQIMSRAELEQVLAEFAVRYERDSLFACRLLIRDVLDRIARDHAKRTWVEASPRNALFAAQLGRMFPRLQMIVCVRDGRDVAASLVRLGWLSDFAEGLRWWADRTRKCHASLAHLRPQSRYVLQFEDLAVRKRAETYSDLLAWLSLEDSEAMRDEFERLMPPDKANVGRWAVGFSEQERRVHEGLYAETLGRLEEEGVGLLPTGPAAAIS